MKKKVISILLATTLLASVFAGCASKADSEAEATDTTEASEDTPEAEAVAEDGAWPAFDGTLYIGVSIRSLANPYHANVVQGAQLLAEDLEAAGYKTEVTVMECDGNDDQQINDIKGLIAKGGSNTVLYVDPNNASLTRTIAEVCEDAGVYWSATWNKEDDSPMDYKYWVTFTSPDDVQTGYDTGKALFEKMGGTGKVCVMGGLEANTASISRIEGFKKAQEEYPDVEVLDTQYCDWDMTKALETTETWLSKFTDVNGIWCADDTMALGTVQALQNAGKNGQIYVTGDAASADALEAVKAGDMLATWDVGGYSQGYYCTAYAVAALVGRIDTEAMEEADRMFLTAGTLVTSDNVEEISSNVPEFDFKEFETFNIGPMN